MAGFLKDTAYPDPPVYCDGGVIAVNPSPHGGTWAWLALGEADGRWRQESGLVLPWEPPFGEGKAVMAGPITNNQMELYAAVMALEAVPKGWAGILWTDSQVTLARLLGGCSFAGIHPSLKQRALDLRRGRKWTVKLVAGHPTRKELAAGTRERNGFPVSRWNVWCDEECQRLAREFLAGLGK
jgi:ribonuclease HI